MAIVEQRNATIARVRAVKKAMEKARDQVIGVLELPLPERDLDRRARRRLEELANEFSAALSALELPEKLLYTTGHTLLRATHRHALSIKNLLHGMDHIVESSEELLSLRRVARTREDTIAAEESGPLARMIVTS